MWFGTDEFFGGCINLHPPHVSSGLLYASTSISMDGIFTVNMLILSMLILAGRYAGEAHRLFII